MTAPNPRVLVDQTELIDKMIAGGAASVGMADVPQITAGQTKAVAVTIKPAQPDTNFNVVALLAGNASLLGALSVESWAVTSKTVVTVNVKNGGLVTLTAGKILVVAAHN